MGDIALFGSYSLNENKQLFERLSDISAYLKQFDLVVGNLESPFSVRKKVSGAKSAYVCSDIINIDLLKTLNIRIVNLANNHIFDYGKEGYETTKHILENAGIEWFGTEGKKVEVLESGYKLLLQGYCCYSTNPLRIVKTIGRYGVNRYNLQEMMTDLTMAKQEGYFSIIAAHAGLEHVNFPSIDHIRAARKMSGICQYLYYGHHPHVIQGVEEFNESLIAHSLGNFCFDDVYANPSDEEPLIKLSEHNRTGLILEVSIENNKVINWREQMIYISCDGRISLLNDDGRLAEYNQELINCEASPKEYMNRRDAIINERVSRRKSMRNLSWFLKRLKPRYFKLAFEMKKNTRMYHQNVKKHL